MTNSDYSKHNSAQESAATKLSPSSPAAEPQLSPEEQKVVRRLCRNDLGWPEIPRRTVRELMSTPLIFPW